MQINIKDHILINKNAANIFAFIANLENDKQWRKEINETTMYGDAKLGVMAKESSYLSKRVPANLLELSCIKYTLNEIIVFKTLPSSPFYLESIRKLEKINEFQTKFIYEITFDKSIVKHGLGIGLPNFLIYMVAKVNMKKYLLKLKEIVEGMNERKSLF